MKRWFTRILICLAMGAVTTVGLAWTLALTMPNLEGDASWVTATGAARTRWAVAALRSPGSLDIGGVAKRKLDWSPDIDEIQVPGWSRAAHPPTRSEVEDGTWFYEHARGWPILALYWRDTYSHASQPPNWRTEWGWEIPGRFAKSRTVPLAVIWPGFLMDALFYGALWFGLIVGLGATKRALRTRRGLCPMCAYDLRGGTLEAGRLCHRIQGCPECGWNRNDDQPPGEAGG